MSRRALLMLIGAACLWAPVSPVVAQRGGPWPGFSSPAGAVPKPETIDVRSPSFGDRTSGVVIDSVVMHTTEVDLSGTLDIFTDIQNQVSSHFVIASNGDLYQMVDTRDRAWHATYYNSRSIGIEMVGFAHQRSTWNEDNLESLVELLSWIVTAYPDIPLEHPLGDAYDNANQRFSQVGIVGHDQIQPWNRSDPGPYFPWDDVLSRVEARIDAALPEPAAGAAVLLSGLGLGRRRRGSGCGDLG